MKMKVSLAKKVIILLVSLCIFATSITGYTFIVLMEKQNFNQVKSTLVKMNTSTYNQINTAVEVSIKNYLQAIANTNNEIINHLHKQVQSNTISEEEAMSLVGELINSQKIGESGYIFVLNSFGKLIEHPFLSGYDASSDTYIQDIISLKNGYLKYKWENPFDPIPRQKVVFMSYFEPWDYIICVSAYSSEFNYLVHTDDFRENILDLQIGKNGYMYVMDSNGTLIIHPENEGENIANSVDAKGNYFVKEMINKKSGSIIYPWKNLNDEKAENKIVVYDYYAPMDWYICSGVDLAELIEPFNQLKTKLFIVILLFLFLAIGISVFYSKLITNPINELINSMKQVKYGNYDSLINIEQEDEIGQLSQIYNEMVGEIKERTENLEKMNVELQKSNETLELRVKERTLQLEELSNMDGLTEIANRRRLDQYLRKILNLSKREKLPISLIMIDIDFFKAYNDTYGHLQGDKCLKEIARAIQDSLRRSTDLVGRYGGEEFSVVLFNTDSKQAIKVAKHIQSSVNQLSIKHLSSSVSNIVTVSMGIATINPSLTDTIENLYSMSDNALYAAKANGRNRIEYTDTTST